MKALNALIKDIENVGVCSKKKSLKKVMFAEVISEI